MENNEDKEQKKGNKYYWIILVVFLFMIVLLIYNRRKGIRISYDNALKKVRLTNILKNMKIHYCVVENLQKNTFENKLIVLKLFL